MHMETNLAYLLRIAINKFKSDNPLLLYSMWDGYVRKAKIPMMRILVACITAGRRIAAWIFTQADMPQQMISGR